MSSNKDNQWAKEIKTGLLTSRAFSRVKALQPITPVLLRIKHLSRPLIYNKLCMIIRARKLEQEDKWHLLLHINIKELSLKAQNKVSELCLYLKILYKKDKLKIIVRIKVQSSL